MINPVKLVAFCLLFSTVTACEAGRDWPNLSDPLPDPAERNRVELEANPVAPTNIETNSAPNTEAEAKTALTDIAATLPRELKAYRVAVEALGAATDTDERKDSWLDAQLKLTRLSRTLSRLDPLIDGRPEASPTRQKALALIDFYEGLVVEERQRLFKMMR